MKKTSLVRILTLSLIVILSITLAISLNACKKSNPSSTPSTPLPIKNLVAFVYQNDSTDGVAFRTLFVNSGGALVTLVDRKAAGSFDFSYYNMIVIGNNTDTLSSSNHWPAGDAMTINNFGKQILLLGEGGLLFAGAIQDTVNWGSSAGNTLSVFKATDPASALYKSPKTINIGSDSLLTIYTSASKVNSFYVKSTPVHNVALIGQEADSKASKYYPVTVANTRYIAFGFYKNVDAMTPAGKDFMVNLAYFAGNLNR
jgi:hypothetical protein